MRERARAVVYNDELVAFAKANSKLLASVEKTFAEYGFWHHFFPLRILIV
jgi:hypothetical protein